MANLTGQLFIDGLWLEGHGDFFESLQPVSYTHLTLPTSDLV